MLPKNYRIMVNGNNRYWVEKKGWFFWRRVNEYLSTSFGDYDHVVYCDSKEAACKWLKEKLKARNSTNMHWKRQREVRNAGPC